MKHILSMGALRGIPAAIAAIDFEPIMVKAMKEDGLTLEEAKVGIRELMRFYALCKLHPGEPFSPSKLMDEMWHLHILDTLKYAPDCDAMFGHFLHHFPYLGMRGADDEKQLSVTFDKSKELYHSLFGEDMHDVDLMTVCGGGCATDEPPPPKLCGSVKKCVTVEKLFTRCQPNCGHVDQIEAESARCGHGKCSSCNRTVLHERPTLASYLERHSAA